MIGLKAIYTAVALFLATLHILTAQGIPEKFRNPNHLEPVFESAYSTASRVLLIGDMPSELWMLVLPSFTPEWAVILRREYELFPGEDPNARDAKVKREFWIVEYVQAEKKIYQNKEYYLERTSLVEGNLLEIRKDGEVNRKKAEVSESLADEVISVWERVIKHTRYPAKMVIPVDGVTFRFYSEPFLYGETISPVFGIPAVLASIGTKMRDLTTSDTVEESEDALEEIQRLIDSIALDTGGPNKASHPSPDRTELK